MGRLYLEDCLVSQRCVQSLAYHKTLAPYSGGATETACAQASVMLIAQFSNWGGLLWNDIDALTMSPSEKEEHSWCKQPKLP